MLNLLTEDCPNTLTTVFLCIVDPSLYLLRLLAEGGGLGALIHPCQVVIITLYMVSELDAGMII